MGASRKAVAIGGGTGLPTVLRCLLDLGYSATAVVTMADDGGSSGALRRELGMLPPGDVRNCLVAMAAAPDGVRASMMQYRFKQGDGLVGHALGNLAIAALADITGSFPAAIGFVGEWLGVRGQVLPSTLADVVLRGVDRSGEEVLGQERLATNPRPVATVFLEPQLPPAYPAALEAITLADVVIIGPGSLYTSLIPNFLVDGIAQAIRCSDVQCVYVCNVANMRGETLGLDAADHVEALLDHGLEGVIDTVVVHDIDMGADGAGAGGAGAGDADGAGGAAFPLGGPSAPACEPVTASAGALARIRAMGAEVVARDLADPENPFRHSVPVLCQTLAEVLGGNAGETLSGNAGEAPDEGADRSGRMGRVRIKEGEVG